MVEISDVVCSRSESVGLMDDELGFVVQAFDGAVVDGHPEVVEDVVFVATHQPGEVSYRRESRMSRPPEPPLEGRTNERPSGNYQRSQARKHPLCLSAPSGDNGRPDRAGDQICRRLISNRKNERGFHRFF